MAFSGGVGCAVYTGGAHRYGPRLADPPWRSARFFRGFPMKAEIQSVVDEIQQALSLLRRHL
jgi:hypothetical protein